MKKHNEGYALVLVLVVITVLSLVAMAMTAASLRNLQNQQKSIERMEAKYAAQGEIEKAIANLNTIISEDGNTASITGFNKNIVKDMHSDLVTSDLSLVTVDGFEQYFRLELKATANETTVTCAIRITGTITEHYHTQGNPTTLYYNISNPRWEYVSYTITEGGALDET